MRPRGRFTMPAGDLAWLGLTSLMRAFRFADGGINMSVNPGANPPRAHDGAYIGDGLGVGTFLNDD